MDEIRFEDGFKRLEEIIARLEDPKTALEDSFEIYKEAMSLTGYLKRKIDKMEKDIKIIVEDPDA